MGRPELSKIAQSFCLIPSRAELYIAVRTVRNGALNPGQRELLGRYGDADQLSLWPRTGDVSTVLGGQVNRSVAEVDGESDDAGHEEKQQPHGVQRHDLPIERSGRLAATFGV